MANEFIIKNGFISKGNSSIEGTFSLNTISATTYQNLPTDVRVTGGTFSAGTATFTNNTGGTFSVTGFSTSSYGVVGISNSSGLYTYYSTISDAMSAATSGQTIEMFADIVETNNVEITLKNGVNIQGNGHTYTLNNSGLIHAIKTSVSDTVNCSILNVNVIRAGSTGTTTNNACLYLNINSTGSINCSGSIFRNTGSGCGIVTISLTFDINYATAYATTIWGAIGIFNSNDVRLNHCIGYGTSGGFGIRCHNGGNVSNCIGYSDSGTGFYGDAGRHTNCVGVSVSGTGFQGAGGGSSTINCIGRSTSGVGFDATNGTNVVNCVGISVSGVGLTSNLPSTHNCTGISNSSRGVTLTGSAIAYNITAKSISSYALLGTNTSKIYGGNIISEWDDATGYGIRGNGGNISPVISNCIIRLANSTSPYLFNDGIAASISMKGNTYTGGASFNPNITQDITSTQDNQGNIYL